MTVFRDNFVWIIHLAQLSQQKAWVVEAHTSTAFVLQDPGQIITTRNYALVFYAHATLRTVHNRETQRAKREMTTSSMRSLSITK